MFTNFINHIKQHSKLYGASFVLVLFAVSATLYSQTMLFDEIKGELTGQVYLSADLFFADVEQPPVAGDEVTIKWVFPIIARFADVNPARYERYLEQYPSEVSILQNGQVVDTISDVQDNTIEWQVPEGFVGKFEVSVHSRLGSGEMEAPFAIAPLAVGGGDGGGALEQPDCPEPEEVEATGTLEIRISPSEGSYVIRHVQTEQVVTEVVGNLIYENLPVGVYSVTFDELAGYEAPFAETVSVIPDEKQTLIRTYDKLIEEVVLGGIEEEAEPVQASVSVSVDPSLTRMIQNDAENRLLAFSVKATPEADATLNSFTFNIAMEGQLLEITNYKLTKRNMLLDADVSTSGNTVTITLLDDEQKNIGAGDDDPTPFTFYADMSGYQENTEVTTVATSFGTDATVSGLPVSHVMGELCEPGPGIVCPEE